MIESASGRLAVVLILLAFQILIFAIELWHSLPELLKWKGSSIGFSGSAFRQWLAPAGLALLSIILISTTFSGQVTQLQHKSRVCSANVDADIAGDGVRIAAFVQVCVLVVIALVGCFHPKATGAKEIGGGLVLTSVSLASALLVRLRRGSLTPPDAAVGAMILDGQSAALLIQLTSKETLASRWQVGIVSVSQIFGLGVMRGITSWFNDSANTSEDCRCLTIFWWAMLSNCGGSSNVSLESAVSWVYFALRCVGVSQMCYNSCFSTRAFDKAEKEVRDVAAADRDKVGPLKRITYNHYTGFENALYEEYPATVSNMGPFSGILALTSLVTAEMTMRGLGIRPSSNVDSVGQIIALVVAGATALRALGLFAFLFKHERPYFTDSFVCPFKFQQAIFTSGPRGWIKIQGTDCPPDLLPLGTILHDPDNAVSKRGFVKVPGRLFGKEREVRNYVHHAQMQSRFSWLLGCLRMHHERENQQVFNIELLKIKWFFSDDSYLKGLHRDTEITQGLSTGSSIFLVIGLAIEERAVPEAPQLDPGANIGQVVAVEVPHINFGAPFAPPEPGPERYLFAYEVRKLVYTTERFEMVGGRSSGFLPDFL